MVPDQKFIGEKRIYCISSADSVTLDLENRVHLNKLVNRCLENMHWGGGKCKSNNKKT